MIDPRSTQAEGHGDAAGYLLGALDPAARARFEAHATTCTECFAELSELQTVADALALSVAQQAPPAHVRQRLLLRAHLATPEIAAPPLAAPPPSVPPAVASPVASPVVAPWWQRAQRWSGALAAVSLAVAVGSSTLAFGTQRQLANVAERAEYASAQLADTLQIVYQPNVVTRVLNGMDAAPGAEGKVVLSPDRNKAVVIAYKLPKLKTDESYQCWLTEQDDKRVDGGLFRPDENGKAYWVLTTPSTMARYRWMGVTKEGPKGSASPNGPRILGGQL
jgi:anti-sigma-K factor RskA